MKPALPDMFFIPISAGQTSMGSHGRLDMPVPALYCHETDLLRANADEAVDYVTEYDDLTAVWCFEMNPNSKTLKGWDASAAIANSWWNKNLHKFQENPDRPIPAFILKHCDYDLDVGVRRKKYHPAGEYS